MAKHYVNNAELLDALIEYRKKIAEAAEAGEPMPRVPEYVGKCILQIATHLSYKPNFLNYTYREEMISDGIENCIQYVRNFDPEKSRNPFAYFTQIVWYAFLRRIQKEKKQNYVKQKLIQEMPFEMFELQQHDEGGTFNNAYVEYLQMNNNLDIPVKPKKAKKSASLEDFTEGDLDVKDL